MGNLMRLAMMAGTGAGVAGLRRAGLKLAWFTAVAVTIGLLSAAAIGTFGMAIFYAILPKLGPAWAAAIVALAFAVSAAILWFSCRHWYLANRSAAPSAGSTESPLANLDLPLLLERNATTVLLAAFIAGMLLNRKR